MTQPQLDADDMRAARAYTKRAYGATLTAKASDDFCAAVYLRSFDRRAPGLEAAGRGVLAMEAIGVAPARQPLPTVVEFDPAAALDAVAVAAPARGRRGASLPEAVTSPRSSDRPAAVHHMRTVNYEAMSSVYDEIERLSTSAVGLAPEFVGWPQMQSTINQMCWLNRTVRTWAGPKALVDVTSHSSVTAVDVPRRVEPETAPVDQQAIGLPSFVKRTKLTGTGVTVAVIDSEVALKHPALHGRVVHRRNYTSENWGNPGEHGTAVAGIIAADDANHGGIAPGSTIYNYKLMANNRLLNGDDFSSTLAMQQAVEDGVDVANCSWGAGKVSSTKSRQAIAVDAAWALGMVVVKSAGNGGPVASTMTCPAEADGVIVVGGTTVDGKKVGGYSSRGPANKLPRPHLVAPGGDDVDRLVCCLVSGGFGDAGYGTSYAAPQVAGVAALLLQQNPKWTPDQVRDALIQSAKSFGRAGRNTQGAGLVQLT